MQKIAIIGSGFIGRAWAISFARAGYTIALWDEKPGAVDEALGYIAMLLPDLAANRLLQDADAAEVLARMRAAPSLEDAVAGAIHWNTTGTSTSVRMSELVRPPITTVPKERLAVLPGSSASSDMRMRSPRIEPPE